LPDVSNALSLAKSDAAPKTSPSRESAGKTSPRAPEPLRQLRTTDPGDVGERIRARRLELGLSQRQVAAPGISYGYISRLERGQRKPTLQALHLLADRLGTTATWLETGEADLGMQLAVLILKYRRQPLPPVAAVLARRLLQIGNEKEDHSARS
jgi:transcriptional regulator with XRE-family HTH domain